MRSPDEVALVLSLAERGLNDSEISRRTGVPRTTVHNWRTGRVPGGPARCVPGATCPRCGHPRHDFGALGVEYAYLLGLYLGDGTIVRFPRNVYSLQIGLDVRYPSIVRKCATAMRWVVPANRVTVRIRLHRGRPSCAEVMAYSKQWPCLFPQHGPGMKHTRPIFLADWQERICMEHTEPFLRGLIHSDGYRGLNRVRHRDKVYEYPRYQFCNASADIRDIFYAACRHIGVDARRMNARNISVARRESVARLDEFIGPKR